MKLACLFTTNEIYEWFIPVRRSGINSVFLINARINLYVENDKLGRFST